VRAASREDENVNVACSSDDAGNILARSQRASISLDFRRRELGLDGSFGVKGRFLAASYESDGGGACLGDSVRDC